MILGSGDIAPQHWQGGALRCELCVYSDLRDRTGSDGCVPGHACLEDVYARRIRPLLSVAPVAV